MIHQGLWDMPAPSPSAGLPTAIANADTAACMTKPINWSIPLVVNQMIALKQLLLKIPIVHQIPPL